VIYFGASTRGSVFSRVDILVTPTTPILPITIEESRTRQESISSASGRDGRISAPEPAEPVVTPREFAALRDRLPIQSPCGARSRAAPRRALCGVSMVMRRCGFRTFKTRIPLLCSYHLTHPNRAYSYR
jgi:hypothetical protein